LDFLADLEDRQFYYLNIRATDGPIYLNIKGDNDYASNGTRSTAS
jgi:hypothetical protein